MTAKKGGRPATGSPTKTSLGKLFARVTLGPKVRRAAQETIVGTARSRVPVVRHGQPVIFRVDRDSKKPGGSS